MTVLLAIILLLFCEVPVSAHVVGQDPYLRINGKDVSLYNVPGSSLDNFTLAQDGSGENYLVGQSLAFELIKTKLPAPPEIVDKSRFEWDMGDGNKASGLTVHHSYQKSGTYYITILAFDGTSPEGSLIETLFVTVLPSLGYTLPQARIRVNNQESTDPLTQIIDADLSMDVVLDGSLSQPGTGKIVSYLWDIGDFNSSDQKKVTHRYKDGVGQALVVLRVTDDKGIISDTYVSIANKKGALSPPSINSQPSAAPNQLMLSLAVILGLLGIAGVARALLRRRFIKKKADTTL